MDKPLSLFDASLRLILQHKTYLVGDTPTLADLTVAGLSIFLKFPEGSYLDIPTQLKGKGIPGLADNSDYDIFFDWRDRLYADYRKTSGSSTPSNDSAPTAIEIE